MLITPRKQREIQQQAEEALYRARRHAHECRVNSYMRAHGVRKSVAERALSFQDSQRQRKKTMGFAIGKFIMWGAHK